MCNTLNSTISGLYNSTFSNVNANVYVEFGNAGFADSSFQIGGVSFSSYTTQFQAESTDTAALASLPTTEPDGLTGDVFLTAAEAEALGYDISGVEYGVEADGVTPCLLSSPGCYNGVVDVGTSIEGGLYFRTGGPIGPSQVDYYMLVEHETDEILGTASCLATMSGTVGDVCTDTNGNGLAPTDLYRYASPGTFAWASQANSDLNAYFSLDGGNTVIEYYNDTNNGGDLGDWSLQNNNFCPSTLVQDYDASPGCTADITSDTGTPEVQLLNAVGFNLATPEPATFALLGSGFAMLGGIAYRRRRKGRAGVI